MKKKLLNPPKKNKGNTEIYTGRSEVAEVEHQWI